MKSQKCPPHMYFPTVFLSKPNWVRLVRKLFQQQGDCKSTFPPESPTHTDFLNGTSLLLLKSPFSTILMEAEAGWATSSQPLEDRIVPLAAVWDGNSPRVEEPCYHSFSPLFREYLSEELNQGTWDQCTHFSRSLRSSGWKGSTELSI